jgi:hypothetical protein
MTDPTNARMRTLNSFFESPRFALKALPVVPDEPEPTPTPTPATLAATPAPVAVAVAPPALTLALQPAAKRTLKSFLADGLLVKVSASRPVVDVEARLFEVLAGGGLRPLGSAFRVEPGPDGASLRIEATRFARSALKRGKGTRTLQLEATATGRDGVVGKSRSTFHLR